MKNEKIIISGPPGSGKTTIINELKKMGHICFSEIRPLNINLHITGNKLLISKHIFKSRKEQFNTNCQKKAFYDRSLIDVIAYMKFWNEKYPISWENDIHKYRYYHKVFYTNPWKEIYEQTNDRKETFEEAKKINKFLRKTYLNLNYKIIDIPQVSTSKRIKFIINNI